MIEEKQLEVQTHLKKSLHSEENIYLEQEFGNKLYVWSYDEFRLQIKNEITRLSFSLEIQISW